MGFEYIDTEIQKAKDSGLYPIVDLNIFYFLEHQEFNNKTKIQLEITLELYEEYIKQIKQFDIKTQKLFLKALKHEELIASHTLENANPFITSMYAMSKDKTAIDKFLNIINKQLTSKDLLSIHYTLLKDTPSEEEKITYRDNNRRIVGKFQNGERKIEYFPIDYTQIKDATKLLLSYYNSNQSDYLEKYLKPIILHGLIASLQIFDDGNTRLARLFQNIEIYKITKKELNENFSTPILYNSKTYYPYRSEYRGLIANLVKENNTEAWNDWFIFNLKRIQDQIYVNENNITELKRTIK